MWLCHCAVAKSSFFFFVVIIVIHINMVELNAEVSLNSSSFVANFIS